MNEAGVVYVATRREHFLVEAFLSAHSIKDVAPDIPITLYTDLPHLPYASGTCFNEVVPLKTEKKYRSQWGSGQLDRIRSLIRSPYMYTLHLDTDTRVLTPDVKQLFDKLDNIDMAMAICQPDASVCATHTGLSMFNVGVILFRRSEKVSLLLNAWEALTTEHFDLGNQESVPEVACLSHIDDPELRRKLLFMDQTSMVQLFSPEVNRFDLEYEILDESWNYRGTSTNRQLKEPLKISHHPELRGRLGVDAVNLALRYQQSGDVNMARKIFQNLLKEYPFNEEDKAAVKQLIQRTFQAG